MSPPAAPTAAKNMLRRFRRNRRGSAIIEFALIAPVFIALLFAIIETSLMFFASEALQTINENAARLIKTGQAQAAYPDVGTYLTSVICSPTPVLFTCNSTNGSANGISVDIKSYSSFQNVSISSQIQGGNFDTSTLSYSLGGSCDVVVARLFYQWPLFVTGLGYNISNLNGNKRLLVATAVFRNEPYSGACGS
ncbi:MAG: pilus assembly protein [Bradyrhizobium sp.]|uniref:TadE/TadG family type IV pilus assembly protein n=1 Tax=Bradyrhizobium sp. TaxID=376 RepID=UPI001C2A4751|nr:TadE family protein [Bradyrhizobium sp.]MBU6463053.1 pilus assembly protein [Pseudomonadota bacterium]MDE2069253.1 pilus assembly protein [Bradyrhizobium sp.]MDE2242244.1 pilus assembly protein [Bradyrhizobium sp.]MDE2468545.1 pilus assembly protein [Bradyrhizobium sp.]